MKSTKIFDIIYTMKEKQLKKIAKQIKQLEANIEKAYEVEESQRKIEQLMRGLSVKDMLELDDMLFQMGLHNF